MRAIAIFVVVFMALWIPVLDQTALASDLVVAVILAIQFIAFLLFVVVWIIDLMEPNQHHHAWRLPPADCQRSGSVGRQPSKSSRQP